jgi:hypothetical protein
MLHYYCTLVVVYNRRTCDVQAREEAQATALAQQAQQAEAAAQTIRFIIVRTLTCIEVHLQNVEVKLQLEVLLHVVEVSLYLQQFYGAANGACMTSVCAHLIQLTLLLSCFIGAHT